MEPKDFLFDDNEKNTNKPALQNINQNYKILQEKYRINRLP